MTAERCRILYSNWLSNATLTWCAMVAILCCTMLCHASAMLCHAALCCALMSSFTVQAFKGDYKWILYGDDDTFFFVDGVLELLQDFDPSLPYFITGTSSAQCLCLKPWCQSQQPDASFPGPLAGESLTHSSDPNILSLQLPASLCL